MAHGASWGGHGGHCRGRPPGCTPGAGPAPPRAVPQPHLGAKVGEQTQGTPPAPPHLARSRAPSHPQPVRGGLGTGTGMGTGFFWSSPSCGRMGNPSVRPSPEFSAVSPDQPPSFLPARKCRARPSCVSSPGLQFPALGEPGNHRLPFPGEINQETEPGSSEGGVLEFVSLPPPRNSLCPIPPPSLVCSRVLSPSAGS